LVMPLVRATILFQVLANQDFCKWLTCIVFFVQIFLFLVREILTQEIRPNS
jgi:hypothetical protein